MSLWTLMAAYRMYRMHDEPVRLFFLLSRKMKASLTCAVWSRWRHRAHRRHELLIVWCRVFDSPQTHLEPDVRWSDINREAENEITSYSANQNTLFPTRFYFGAAKLLLGECRPDSMRRQPFLIWDCGVSLKVDWWPHHNKVFAVGGPLSAAVTGNVATFTSDL